jgi:hypothetical protein
LGIAMAAMMPMIATTIRSSISVNPFADFFIAFSLLDMRTPLKKLQLRCHGTRSIVHRACPSNRTSDGLFSLRPEPAASRL